MITQPGGPASATSPPAALAASPPPPFPNPSLADFYCSLSSLGCQNVRAAAFRCRSWNGTPFRKGSALPHRLEHVAPVPSLAGVRSELAAVAPNPVDSRALCKQHARNIGKSLK